MTSGDSPSNGGEPRQQLFELGAAGLLRAAAPVFALPFQQVVGQHPHGGVFQHLAGQALAADALLQQGEGLGAAVLPDQQFAVDHAAVGQLPAEGVQLGEALGDQLFAPGPDPQLAVAAYQLRADAVPLPFRQPVAGRAEAFVEGLGLQLQRVGEEEGVGLAAAFAVFVGAFGGDQPAVAVGAGDTADVGVADHALGDALGVQAAEAGQGAGHQQARDADAEGAGDEFVEHQQAVAIEPRPEPRQALGEFGRRQAAQGQQVLFQPVGEALLAVAGGGGNSRAMVSARSPTLW